MLGLLSSPLAVVLVYVFVTQLSLATRRALQEYELAWLVFRSAPESLLWIGLAVGLFGAVVGLRSWRQHRLRVCVPRHRRGVVLSVCSVILSGVLLTANMMVKDHAQQEMNQRMFRGPVATQWQGAAAPDFVITTVDGQRFSLSSLRGKHVLLDFWATTCPPCRAELPHLNKLARESPDQLVILGLSREAEERVRKYVLENGTFQFPVASVGSLPDPYAQLRTLPTLVAISPEGILRDVMIGYHDLAVIRRFAYDGDEASSKERFLPPTSATAQ